MANVLTNLIPDLYAGIDTVSRELTGFIPAVSRQSTAERAAVGQQVTVPVTQEESATDINPGVTPPDDGDTTVGTRFMTISKARRVPIRFTGEEIRGLQTQDNGTGDGYEQIRQDRIAQAVRTLANEVETDLGTLAKKASRAYGTAGTTPFGTKDDFSDFAGVSQILDDNGAPPSERQLVGGSAAWFNLRGTQTGVLQRANEAGTDEALRMGEFGQIHGMVLRNSAQTESFATGTITDTTTDSAASEGDTTIPVATASGGTVDVSEGDVITLAGDDAKYVVAASTSLGESETGEITIREPGLQQDVATATAVDAVADYEANVAFHRNAIQLATRVPAIPEEGDVAIDRTVIQDPRTGLAMEFSVYPQYRQVQYEVAMVWGFEATKEEHMALLLG